MVLLLSKGRFWRMALFFFLARMSLFYAQMWQSNFDKIRTKWQFDSKEAMKMFFFQFQFYSKKAMKVFPLLSTYVKTNFFWGIKQFYSKNEFIFFLKCVSLIVTKYARNDSFIKKKAMKMVLLLSKRVKKGRFWRMALFIFLARMSLFYAQMWQSNFDKIRTKWQFYSKKAMKMFFSSFSFIQKKQSKCFLCSLHTLKRTFFEE